MMKPKLVVLDAKMDDMEVLDHSEAILANPSRYGFSYSELPALTENELRIGMTKVFLQARAEIRVKQIKKRYRASEMH